MTEQTAQRIVTLHDTRALVCAPDGPLLRSDRDAVDIIGAMWAEDATLVVVPVERLDRDFFTLSSGIAGAIVQKFAGYRLRLVIRGNVSAHIRRSSAFRGFVEEANRGTQLWFVGDDAELAARLAA